MTASKRMTQRRQSIQQAIDTFKAWPEWKQQEMRRWQEETRQKIQESMNERD